MVKDKSKRKRRTAKQGKAINTPSDRGNPMTMIAFNLLMVDKTKVKIHCNEALERLGMVCLQADHVKYHGFPTTTFKLKVILEEGDAEESVLTARARLMAKCFASKASMIINKVSYSCTFSKCCLYCKVTGHEIKTCQSYFDHVRPVTLPPPHSEEEMYDEENID